MMENYTKGEVIEVDAPPVFSPDETSVEMRVNSGSKIRNLMGYAMKKFKEPVIKKIVWSGSGKAITKTISCAEIMKRKIKGLHQINKLRHRRIEEFWEPKLEGLERLKVNRDVPAISVLLSKDPLDPNEPGYQAPGSFDEFWRNKLQQGTRKEAQRKKNYSTGDSSVYKKKMRKMEERQNKCEKSKVKDHDTSKGKQSYKSGLNIKDSGDKGS